MRAREPDQAGYVVRDEVRVYYEMYGRGTPTVLLMPTWSFVDSRHWKLQIPYPARDYRVVTFDPRGNGRSDRPSVAGAYADSEFVADALAVMGETATERAIVAGLWPGVRWCVQLAAAHPEGVLGLVALAPGVPHLTPSHTHRVGYSFNDIRDVYEGWAKQNRDYWLRDYPGYVEWHSAELLPEPHSIKLYDDAVEWSFERRPETLILTVEAPGYPRNREEAENLYGRLRCPTLIIHVIETCVSHTHAPSGWQSSRAVSSSRSEGPGTCLMRATR